MANNRHGRKLSELLREQQEPFLVYRGAAPAAEVCRRRLRGLCDRGGSVSERGRRRRGVRNGTAFGTTTVACGGKAVRMALRWDLAGCFSCGTRERFRRLPRAGADIDGDELSPVSVLQLQSDELSHSNWGDDDEDDSKPSTSSGSSTPPYQYHRRRRATSSSFTLYSNSGGKVRAAEAEDHGGKFQTRKTEQAAVSAWERIAADISRIPRLVELDLSGSVREWRRRIGEEEARRVGESIEAIIFEELRWDAVRDIHTLLASCSLNRAHE